MSERRELSAKDFIVGLLASDDMNVEQVAQAIACAKKGMEVRYQSRVDVSWKPAELKKLRGRLLFGQWSWFDHGQMFRQSWDGTIAQDVKFFSAPDCAVGGPPRTRRAFQMLVELANRAVAKCDGKADVKVVLTSEQIGIFYADKEV